MRFVAGSHSPPPTAVAAWGFVPHPDRGDPPRGGARVPVEPRECAPHGAGSRRRDRPRGRLRSRPPTLRVGAHPGVGPLDDPGHWPGVWTSPVGPGTTPRTRPPGEIPQADRPPALRLARTPRDLGSLDRRPRRFLNGAERGPPWGHPHLVVEVGPTRSTQELGSTASASPLHPATESNTVPEPTRATRRAGGCSDAASTVRAPPDDARVRERKPRLPPGDPGEGCARSGGEFRTREPNPLPKLPRSVRSTPLAGRGDVGVRRGVGAILAPALVPCPRRAQRAAPRRVGASARENGDRCRGRPVGRGSPRPPSRGAGRDRDGEELPA